MTRKIGEIKGALKRHEKRDGAWKQIVGAESLVDLDSCSVGVFINTRSRKICHAGTATAAMWTNGATTPLNRKKTPKKILCSSLRTPIYLLVMDDLSY